MLVYSPIDIKRTFCQDLEEKDDSINQLINDKAVYRTAPATLGLLIRKESQMVLLKGWGRKNKAA